MPTEQGTSPQSTATKSKLIVKSKLVAKIMEMDTEIKFIKLVQGHKCIYDKNHKASEQDIKNAWLEISRRLPGIPVQHLQLRWKQMRQRFSKERRRESTSGRSTWVSYEALKFLDGYVKHRNNFSSNNIFSEISNTSSNASNANSDQFVFELLGDNNDIDNISVTEPKLEFVDVLASNPNPKIVRGADESMQHQVEFDGKKPDINTAFGGYVAQSLNRKSPPEQKRLRLLITRLLEE